MISFNVDVRFIDDLHDDFVVNENLTLYEFIGKDPIKAFYLGLNIAEWFKEIDRNQKYLYSKQARHNKDGIEKYQTQIEFWSKKFPKEGEIDMVELAEYIMNNIFYEEKTKEIDMVKLAFFFGDIISNSQKEDKDHNE